MIRFIVVGHTNWVKCCKFSSTDVNLVASCGDDSTLRLFDLRVHVRKGACVKTLEATRNRHFTHLDWFPKHSHYIAVASSNAMIRIYDLRNAASIVQFYAPHTQSVNAVSFHPSGAYLLSCSTDRSCKLIDVQEGRLLYTLRGHTKPLFACAFDRDGRHFVTAGADAGVRLWQSNLPASSSSSSSSIITDDHLTKCDYSNGPLDSAGQPDQRCEFGKRKNALNGIDAQSNYSSVAKSSVVDSMFTFPMNQTSFDQQSLDATVDGHHQLLDNHSSHHRSHCAESSLKGSKSLQSLVKGSPSSLEVNEIRHVMKQMLQDIQTFTDTLTRLESRLTFLEDKMLN